MLDREQAAGDGYLGFLFDGPGFAKRIQQVRELAAERGRDPQSIVAALVTFAHVGPDRDSAIDIVAQRLEANYGVPMRTAVERYGVVGTLEQCAERVRSLVAAGVEHLVLASPLGGAEFDEQLASLAVLRERVR